jgi:hypothetical protein
MSQSPKYTTSNYTEGLHVYMEASYPAMRVTRPGGTNKRSFYMEPSYSAFAAWLPHDAEMAPKHKKELAKVSYSAASCKQSLGITISFYNSRDLAVAE